MSQKTYNRFMIVAGIVFFGGTTAAILGSLYVFFIGA